MSTSPSKLRPRFNAILAERDVTLRRAAERAGINYTRAHNAVSERYNKEPGEIERLIAAAVREARS